MIALNKKKGLFSFINDIPLNFKFLIIYIVCILIPIFVINFVFWNKISKYIKERETENFNISIDRVKSDIYSILEGCIDVSYSVSSDKVLYEKLESSYSSYSEYYVDYHDLLRDRINRYLPIYNDVSNIALYTSNYTIDSGGSYYYITKSVKNSLWYKHLHDSYNKVDLYTYRDKANDGTHSYVQHLSVVRELDEFDFISKKYEHILKIDIDLNKLYYIFNREKSYLNLFLVDPEGRIVCSTDGIYEKDLSKHYVKFKDIFSGEKDSINFIRSLGTTGYLSGWNIIGIANRNYILKESRKSNIVISLIVFIVTLISSFMIYIIVRSYNYRVKKLLKHIRRVGDQNFDLIEIAEGKDEIGQLILSFNMMTSKINTLINDVYKLQIKRKDLEIQKVQAELKFLQSQVDPHFLFNTLNAVMAVCIKNNYTELTDVIKYISKIFRRLISWKEDLVSVKEEISFTEMYLKIEKFRFLDKFDYQIKADEKILDLKVPKMSIQTLVENACKHGIQSSAGVGVVKIRVDQKDGLLCVDVEDNGVGIEKDKLDLIMETLEEEDAPYENVGIKNVYKRLHLYYGDEVEFSIKSEINNGTAVHYAVNMDVLNTNIHLEHK